jgi:hypothetical protein
MKSEIPSEVRAYLSAGDGLGQASVREQHPDLDRVLDAPSTRSAIIAYLASDEPLKDSDPGFAMNALAFLQGAANAQEVGSIHHLLRHPLPSIRARAAGYMMAVYYPGRDRNGMLSLFKETLNDSDELVRVQTARWIKGTDSAPAMEGFLETWILLAHKNKWDRTESFQIIESLSKH